jgi:hypothetical protein
LDIVLVNPLPGLIGALLLVLDQNALTVKAQNFTHKPSAPVGET